MNKTNIDIFWNENEHELNKILSVPFACMFSGGKDCGLALSLALDYGKAIKLIHCLQVNTDKSLWHLQDKDVVKMQADAIGIPVEFTEYSIWNTPFEIVKLYKRLKEQGVQSVVFGDIEDKEAKYQAYLCYIAGLKPCMPLWKKEYSELLDLLIIKNIKSVITTIDSPLIDKKWLGKEFDEEAYKSFKKVGVNPFGEFGEFHTTLVGAHFFSAQLIYGYDESGNFCIKHK